MRAPHLLQRLMICLLHLMQIFGRRENIDREVFQLRVGHEKRLPPPRRKRRRAPQTQLLGYAPASLSFRWLAGDAGAFLGLRVALRRRVAQL